LKKGGWLMIEHGYDQSQMTLDLLKQNNFKNTKNYLDIGENPRLSIAKLPL